MKPPEGTYLIFLIFFHLLLLVPVAYQLYFWLRTYLVELSRLALWGSNVAFSTFFIKILKLFWSKRKDVQVDGLNTCRMLILQSENKEEVAQHWRKALHPTISRFPKHFHSCLSTACPEKPIKRRKLWGIVHPLNLGCWAQHFETKRRNSCRKRHALWESVPPPKKAWSHIFCGTRKNFLQFCIFRESFSEEGPLLGGGGEY